MPNEKIHKLFSTSRQFSIGTDYLSYFGGNIVLTRQKLAEKILHFILNIIILSHGFGYIQFLATAQ